MAGRIRRDIGECKKSAANKNGVFYHENAPNAPLQARLQHRLQPRAATGVREPAIFRLILRHVVHGHACDSPAAARRQLEGHLSWRSGTYARSTTFGTTRRLDRRRLLLYALHRDHADALAGQTLIIGFYYRLLCALSHEVSASARR
jgi:hypothetical protein